jgi:hypothetical protein
VDLDGLTVEERLRLIKKMLYEQSVNPPWVEPIY